MDCSLIRLVDRRESLDEAERDARSTRAREVFLAFFGRQIGSDRFDVARIGGIELALLDHGIRRQAPESDR